MQQKVYPKKSQKISKAKDPIKPRKFITFAIEGHITENRPYELKELIEKYNVTREELSFNNNWFIKDACDAELIKILLTKLTAEDCRSCNNHALRTACMNRSYKCIDLLLTKLTINDITKEMYDNIIKNNDIKSLQVLIKHGLTKDTKFEK